MFEDFDDPTEMRVPDDALTRAKTTGARRVRRRYAVVTTAAVVLLAAIAVPAIRRDDKSRTTVGFAHQATTTESTVAPSTTSTAVLPTKQTHAVRSLTTTTITCRNSFNPLCGDFRWDPAVSDATGTMGIQMTPEHPKAGEEVTFVFTADDPDSPLSLACGIPGYNFGDGTNNAAEQDDCARTSWPRCQMAYGPWDPPEPRPGHLQVELKHTFAAAGFYSVSIGIPPQVFTPEAATAAGNQDGGCMSPYHVISWGNALQGVTVDAAA